MCATSSNARKFVFFVEKNSAFVKTHCCRPVKTAADYCIFLFWPQTRFSDLLTQCRNKPPPRRLQGRHKHLFLSCSSARIIFWRYLCETMVNKEKGKGIEYQIVTSKDVDDKILHFTTSSRYNLFTGAQPYTVLKTKGWRWLKAIWNGFFPFT